MAVLVTKQDGNLDSNAYVCTDYNGGGYRSTNLVSLFNINSPGLRHNITFTSNQQLCQAVLLRGLLILLGTQH